MGLVLLIARTKPIKERQKADLKRMRSYKGDTTEAEKLFAQTKKILKAAKAARKAVIGKLLKAQAVAPEK